MAPQSGARRVGALAGVALALAAFGPATPLGSPGSESPPLPDLQDPEGKLRAQIARERVAHRRLVDRFRREVRALRRVARDVRYPTPAGNRRLARAYFRDEYECAAVIINGETGGTWSERVAYGFRYGPGYLYSGLAYGLGQARPGTKMLAYGADAATNPLTQLRWFRGYAEARYGSVCGAAAHWTPARSW